MAFGSQHQKVALACILVLALAGCLHVSTETTVGAEGEIEEYQMEITMDSSLYNLLEEQAAEEGYESVEESIVDELDDEGWESVEYAEEFEDGDMIMTITAEGGNPDELEHLDVEVEEEEITFVSYGGLGAADEEVEEENTDDEFMADEEMPDMVSYEYTVHMPGEVTDTNGEIQEDGNSVSWNSQNHELGTELRATSERPTGIVDMPGFGVPVAIGALLLALGVGAMRSRQ